MRKRSEYIIWHHITELTAQGLSCISVSLTPFRFRDAVKRTLDRFGSLNFLVNNGGGQFPSPAADIRPKGWNAVIDTNLTGTFNMSRAGKRMHLLSARRIVWHSSGKGKVPIVQSLHWFAAYNSHFRDGGGGSIVNITADSFRGMPMMAHTSAARAAVDNLTKWSLVGWPFGTIQYFYSLN